MQLNIQTPRWAKPLLTDKRYIGAKGGRSSGKSHFFAERVMEWMLAYPDDKIVCIREIQKSLKFSAYTLIKDKILNYDLSSYFEITNNEIKRKGYNGVCIFQGMQDHTADSIKSLEGFKIAWVEEAQKLSAKSLKLLRPTIRINGSQIWFSWNPDDIDDPVDAFMKNLCGDGDWKGLSYGERAICVHVNYDDNPFLPDTAYDEMLSDKQHYPDDFDHVWLGDYNTRSDVRVFHKWVVQECEPEYADNLYFGCDFGFSVDPTVLLRTWKNEDTKEIYIDYQIDGIGIETDHLPDFFKQVPESDKWRCTADSARPESISYLKRHNFNIVGASKGKGSVEAGIDWLRGYTLVIHPRCKLLQKEVRLYSYKTDRNGNILPKVDDQAGLDHCIDALRYAYEAFIKNQSTGGFITI